MTVVNLLAAVQERRTAPDRGPFGPLLVGALALALVAVVAYAISGRGIADRQQQLTVLTTQAASSVAEVEALSDYVEVDTEARSRAESVGTLARSRYPWERALDDLTRVLPHGADLSSIAASVPAAGTSAADADAARPTIALKGCLSSQGQVPELLSRLRTVRGATDVKLNASDAETKDDTAACTGEAPSFDVVLTFGGWKAAEAAATPTPAPSPAGDGA